MKNNIKKTLLLAVVLCLVFTTGALAASNYKLVVNGQVAQGVEIKVINGVTYLPLRAVGDLLNVPVSYDGTTKTITVGSSSTSATTSTSSNSSTSSATSATDNVYRVGNISFINVQTKKSDYGWDIDCEIRNNDTKDYSYISYTATYYNAAGTRIGTAVGNVADLEKAETKTVSLFTGDDLTGWTKIKFQIDVTM